MTTIVPYTIYSIPFFNFVQILTQIFTKKCDSHFAPAAAILYKGGVFARYFYLQHLAKKFMNKTKFLLYTYIIFQTQFLSKEKLKKRDCKQAVSLFFCLPHIENIIILSKSCLIPIIAEISKFLHNSFKTCTLAGRIIYKSTIISFNVST